MSEDTKKETGAADRRTAGEQLPGRAPAAADGPAVPAVDARKARALRLLRDLLSAGVEVGAEALRADAAAWERTRLACKALEGDLLAGADRQALARRWADLRAPEHVARAPWGALNRVLEAFVGEEEAELVKQQAAALVRRVVRQPGTKKPAASTAGYTAHLRERLRQGRR